MSSSDHHLLFQCKKCQHVSSACRSTRLKPLDGSDSEAPRGEERIRNKWASIFLLSPSFLNLRRQTWATNRTIIQNLPSPHATVHTGPEKSQTHHSVLYFIKRGEMASPMVATPVRLQTTGGLGLSFSSTPAAGRTRRRFAAVRASAEAMATEKLGIRVERNPPESRLSDLGVRQWPKWGCEASKFPWTYSAKETCYLLQGKVKVYPDGEADFVEIAAGDLVVFPKGMSCTWDVSDAVDKHYKFE